MEKINTRVSIQKILNHFSYSLRSIQKSSFAVQNELITVKEPTIFDLGAYVGDVAKEYRRQFPLAKIYCFEPFPQSFQSLSQNLEGMPNTFCFQSAVSDNKGTALLNTNLNSATNSLLKTDERGTSFWGEGLLDTMSQIEVRTTTIDTFCLEEKISHIDILKMDVQGAEFSVLMGAKNMLANQRISLIYTEMIICPTYAGQHKLYEYLSFLDSFGYDFIDFFNPVRFQNQLIQADIVFLSSTFKKKLKIK